MKNTGIVRKIDELGRIVIPKEVRKVLNINSSDDLEFYVVNNQIVLSKYSMMFGNKESVDQLLKQLQDLTNDIILISDRDKIISEGIYENNDISQAWKSIINDRQTICSKTKEIYEIGDISIEGYFALYPIIKDSDAIGLIIIYSSENITERSKTIAEVLKKLIENQ